MADGTETWVTAPGVIRLSDGTERILWKKENASSITIDVSTITAS